jgi:predicted nuclease of predicted toxin-antitoxin system
VRILLDECVHRGVRLAFPGHAVACVTDTEWRSSKDPTLLGFAERNFDVFVTIDRTLAPY